MVAAIFVEGGKVRVLEELEDLVVDRMRFGLFKSAAPVDEDTDFSGITECDFDGYARFSASWSVITVDGLGRARRIADTITWVFVGPTGNDVYGFFVVDDDDDELLFVHRFAAPRSMHLTGDEVSIIPTILVGNLAPP